MVSNFRRDIRRAGDSIPAERVVEEMRFHPGHECGLAASIKLDDSERAGAGYNLCSDGRGIDLARLRQGAFDRCVEDRYLELVFMVDATLPDVDVGRNIVHPISDRKSVV